jgi:thioesterase domain-containing protein
VAEFAEILRQDGWAPSWSSLVPIRPAGSRNPLFLVHGAEGNVLLYRAVTQYLDPEQPVYGLQSRGLNGDGHVDTTVPEMASKYVKDVLAIQPNGPYFLGGYCLGGTIAFEMAQQLREMGQDVELVIMLDTYNEHLVSRPKVLLQAPLHWLQNLWFHGANMLSVPPSDRRKFLKEKVETTLGRLVIRFHAALHAVQGLVSSKKASSYPHLTVKRVNDAAAFRYVPRPYDGRVAVIRSKGAFIGLTSPSLGWDEIVRDGLEIHELPVYPRGMLVEPFCRQLAETLRLCLKNT